MTTTMSTKSKGGAFPWVIGIPIGLYAGSFGGLVAGLVSGWYGVAVIPAFLITTGVTTRFIVKQLQGLRERSDEALDEAPPTSTVP